MRAAITKFISASQAGGVTSIARGASGELTGWVENGYLLSVTRDITAKQVVLTLIAGSLSAVETLNFSAADLYLGSTGESIPTELSAELQSAGVAGTKFAGSGGGGGGASSFAALTGNATDNTSLATALAGRIAATEKAAANGVATLDASGKLLASQVPDIALVQYLGSVASQSAMLSLNGQQGDWCTRSDTGTNFVLTATPSSTLANWVQLSGAASSVTSVAGRSGAVVLTKTDVGLSNVDNTADASKPVSTLQAAAIAKKADAVNASPVVAGGVTSLTRTAVTTAGAEAPTGYYNRPLLSDHSLTVDATGAVAGDAIMVLNTSGSAITLTAGSLIVSIPANKAAEIAYNGTAFVDTTPAGGGGGTYTDAQALAAAVLGGALGSSTTQAPTHAAVSSAIAAMGGGNVGVVAPSAFAVAPISQTRAVMATITVPAGTVGARGMVDIPWEVVKSGVTDGLNVEMRIGPIGGTNAAAFRTVWLTAAAANSVIVSRTRLRAVGAELKLLMNNSFTAEGVSVPANYVAVTGVDPAAGFVIYFVATTGTTDTVSLGGAHATCVKVG